MPSDKILLGGHFHSCLKPIKQGMIRVGEKL